jgi:hypothetical protein
MARTIELLSVDPEGIAGDDTSENAAISADGLVVAFESIATNLVPGYDTDLGDIFVRDRGTGVTELVSVGYQDDPADGYSYRPSISADGRFIAFSSDAANLVADDTNDTADIFVRDRQTGMTVRVSVDADGNEGDGYSSSAAISADGRFVAFASGAENLVADDTNDVTDLFVVDREAGTIARISVGTEGQQANNGSFAPALSADGALAAFHSYAPNFGFEDYNGTGDIFLATTALVPPPVVPPLPPLAEGVAVPDEAINGVPREALTLTAGRDAAISFVDEYTGFQNSVGVYLVGPDGQIIQPRWVFERIEHAVADDSVPPSVRPGGGPSQPGDTVWLSDLYDPAELQEGTEFGLFLVADGAARNPFIVFDHGTLEFRSDGGIAKVTDVVPQLVHTSETGTERVLLGDIMHTVDAGSPNPLSNKLNPPASPGFPVGGRGQALSGLLDGKFVVAFEDQPFSASDKDFNDAIFAVNLLDSGDDLFAAAAGAGVATVPAGAALETLLTPVETV